MPDQEFGFCRLSFVCRELISFASDINQDDGRSEASRLFSLFPNARRVLSGTRFQHNGGVVALAALPPECSPWRRRFERAYSKGWLIKGAFHLWIGPGTPETWRSSDAKRLTAEALMTPVDAGETKHQDNRSGGE